MLEPRLLPVAAISLRDEDAHHCHYDLHELLRHHEHARIASKRLVPRRAPERDSKCHAVAVRNCFRADVVRVLDCADEPAAIHGDVELARQIVKRAVIDDARREVVGERTYVNQLHRVHARRRVRREVADVVRARAPRVKSDRLDAPQHFGRVLRRDQPDLEIRPRRDLHVARRQLIRDPRNLAELMRAEEPARNPQPRHVCVFHRCEEKEPVPFEAEDFLLIRRLVADSVLQDLPIRLQRMQLTLHALLEDEIIERRRGFLCDWSRIGKAHPALRNPGEKPREIFFLFAGKRCAAWR